MGTSRLYLPKFEGPLDLSRKAVQLKTLLGRQQLNQQFLQSNQLKLQQAQRGQQEQQQVDQIIAKHKGDLRAALPEIMKVSPRSGRELQTWLTNWDRQDTQKKLEVLNLSIKKTQRKAQLASGVRDQASYEAAVNKGLQEQLYDQPTAQQMLAVPYDPKNVRAIQRQALTSQQWFSLEQNRLQSEQQQQQDALNAPEKVHDFLARTMGPVQNQKMWTAHRNFAQARLKKMGVSEDYLDLIPEQYSPQAAQQMKELGIKPAAEKTAKPSARDLSGREATLVEDEAVRALQEAGDDADRAIEMVNQSANIPARLKAKIRQRIRERVRPGAGAPSDIDELRGLLTGAGATGRANTRQESAEGRTAINPETGEKVVYRGGKWVPVPK